MNVKHFTCGKGLVLTLPMSLKAAPGAQPFRLDDQTSVSLDMDAQNVKANQRFIACALRDGDFVEIEKPIVAADAQDLAPPPAAKPKFAVNPPKE